MKNAISLTSILFTLLISQSCKKEESTPTPTPTPTESKTFITYVDGVKFEPNISNVYIDTNRDGNYLVKELIAEIGNKFITLQFTAQQPGVYTLTGGISGYDVGTYNVGLDSNWICTGSAGGGNLTITKYDVVNNKFSGNFFFKAKIFGTNNIKNITKGTFTDVEIR
jgi:Family of unknown function (DUF6252)